MGRRIRKMGPTTAFLVGLLFSTHAFADEDAGAEPRVEESGSEIPRAPTADEDSAREDDPSPVAEPKPDAGGGSTGDMTGEVVVERASVPETSEPAQARDSAPHGDAVPGSAPAADSDPAFGSSDGATENLIAAPARIRDGVLDGEPEADAAPAPNLEGRPPLDASSHPDAGTDSVAEPDGHAGSVSEFEMDADAINTEIRALHEQVDGGISVLRVNECAGGFGERGGELVLFDVEGTNGEIEIETGGPSDVECAVLGSDAEVVALDGNSGAGRNCKLRFRSEPGVTYLLSVEVVGSREGHFSVCAAHTKRHIVRESRRRDRLFVAVEGYFQTWFDGLFGFGPMISVEVAPLPRSMGPVVGFSGFGVVTDYGGAGGIRATGGIAAVLRGARLQLVAGGYWLFGSATCVEFDDEGFCDDSDFSITTEATVGLRADFGRIGRRGSGALTLAVFAEPRAPSVSTSVGMRF